MQNKTLTGIEIHDEDHITYEELAEFAKDSNTLVIKDSYMWEVKRYITRNRHSVGYSTFWICTKHLLNTTGYSIGEDIHPCPLCEDEREYPFILERFIENA